MDTASERIRRHAGRITLANHKALGPGGNVSGLVGLKTVGASSWVPPSKRCVQELEPSSRGRAEDSCMALDTYGRICLVRSGQSRALSMRARCISGVRRAFPDGACTRRRFVQQRVQSSLALSATGSGPRALHDQIHYPISPNDASRQPAGASGTVLPSLCAAAVRVHEVV